MSSNWVKTEIANARQREEREKKNLLFPITLAAMEEVKKWKVFDADLGIDAARVVREYFIPDFSRWKEHDSYRAASGRLVGDLKAVASGWWLERSKDPLKQKRLPPHRAQDRRSLGTPA